MSLWVGFPLKLPFAVLRSVSARELPAFAKFFHCHQHLLGLTLTCWRCCCIALNEAQEFRFAPGTGRRSRGRGHGGPKSSFIGGVLEVYCARQEGTGQILSGSEWTAKILESQIQFWGCFLSPLGSENEI